jgi:hypothetical protein
MCTLLDLMRIASTLSVGPFTKTVNSVSEAAMGFVSHSTRIKATEV